jgi:hypothetical protein
VKGVQKTLHRQIGTQFQGKRRIPLMATDYEISHRREITWKLRAQEAPEHNPRCLSVTSWIVELKAPGLRDGHQPFRATHLFRTSLRRTPAALLQLARGCWGMESWHWIRDTQLHEDRHSYRGNGVGVMAALRTAAMNLLRLNGFRSICAGLQAVMHDITALLAMARRQSAA